MMNDAQKAAANYVPKNFGICSFLQQENKTSDFLEPES
jgi:hypothetical protein